MSNSIHDDSPKPAESAAVLGVHSVDHFGLAVPNLGDARHFFEAFGLDVRSNGDSLELRTDGSEHRWAVVTSAPARYLTHVSFGAFPEDLAPLHARLLARGVDALSRDDGAIRFRDPDGVRIEILAASKSSPRAKSAPSNVNASSPEGTAAAPLRSKAQPVRPRRLAHVMRFTSDVPRAIAFYCDVLGLRLSDKSGDVAFLHGAHGSDHHMIAFCGSAGPGFHHSAWDVGSVQEVGLGAMQMARSGYGKDGWGLGRHVLGSNYFHYVRDPWNSYAEYSFDIDYVPAGLNWPAGDQHPDDGFYLWGPNPPADFGVNYELVRPDNGIRT